MLGGNDFHSEPPSRRHASEPSLTEMVRRARDARLGATRPPRFTTDFPAERRVGDARWFTGVALLVLGILIGVALTALIGQVSARLDNATPPSSSAAQSAAVAPTATSVPTVTPIPTPTAPAGAATPLSPTTAEILTALTDYINTQSMYAGTYELTAAAIVQERWQDETHLTACIAFDMTIIAAPDTVVDYDMHPVTFVRGSDGAWQVLTLYYSGTCSMD